MKICEWERLELKCQSEEIMIKMITVATRKG